MLGSRADLRPLHAKAAALVSKLLSARTQASTTQLPGSVRVASGSCERSWIMTHPSRPRMASSASLESLKYTKANLHQKLSRVSKFDGLQKHSLLQLGKVFCFPNWHPRPDDMAEDGRECRWCVQAICDITGTWLLRTAGQECHLAGCLRLWCNGQAGLAV